MYIRFLAISLTLAITACSSTVDDNDKDNQSTATSKSGSLVLASKYPVAASPNRSIAVMPDSGSLNVIDTLRVPKSVGGATYTPVRLSETHALNAAAAGRELQFQTPEGEKISIPFVRSEEGMDGNWSWIGKTSDGLEAVITFGQDAVFGQIARKGAAPLRITTLAGSTWIVSASPNWVDGAFSRKSSDTDVLIPPKLIDAAMRKKAAEATASNTTKSGATVDVALGYTNGLVTKYGSASAANTRLTNLIAIANQGYTNSLVQHRIRLVHTLQVNYTDNNDNEIALEALTGFTCGTSGCTQQAVPAQLVPLRTARETYGADLVSLVRPFRTPEQSGCGIAWLLGGGGFPIDNTDAPFGYSIVSDGTDVDETDGRTYFCREETLSHELGHNMGQNHNIEDSGGDTGTHSYSYGYRETTTTGFYTVMAYRLGSSSQFSINYFGNPSVNYEGRPTGLANADNARSMNISMPLVAPFRATVVPMGGRIRNDVNGDGTSDLVWHNGSNLSWWQMSSSGSVVSTGGQATPSNYIAIATGDFDGNGVTSDVLWRQGNILRMWLKASTGNHLDVAVSNYPVGWRLVGAGDLNKDGRTDLIWQSGTTVSIWLMNGNAPTFASASISLPNPGTTPLAVADFSCDAASDILWRNANGELLTWVVNSSSSSQISFTAQTIAQYPNGWVTRGAGDFNADGCDDISWFNGSALSYWPLTANSSGVITVGSPAGRALPTGARLLSILDIGGDGYADLLIRRGNGELGALIDFGRSTTDLGISTFPSGWLPVDGQMPYSWRRNFDGDYDGNARTDLGWTNGSTFSFWSMSGASVLSYGGQNFSSSRTTLGTGDFDGDSLKDILFQTTSGQLVRWRRVQGQFIEEAIGPYPTGWALAGIGDIDGDGKDDIIWQNGAVYSHWIMDGNTVRLVGGQSLPANDYQSIASKDLDGDGRIELLWRTSSSALYASKSTGNAFFEVPLGQFPAGWSFLGAGDVDGDLANDLMWHNGAGTFTHWRLPGLVISPQSSQSMPLTGTVVATGDYDGNGITDLIWQTSGGAVTLVVPNGSPTQASSIFPISSYPSGWTSVR
jgi:peptidyl-Asp metalloendopeptidase